MDPSQLEPGEQIILVTRRHIINFIPILVAAGLVLFASVALPAFLALHADVFGSINLPIAAISSVLLLLDLLAGVIVIVGFLIFRQSRLILTNIHLIQIIQSGLFGRSLSKFSLDELQDVKGNRSGFFATVFNYGELNIQTAGTTDNFVFRPVANPLVIAETINDAHEAFEKAHTFVRQ